MVLVQKRRITKREVPRDWVQSAEEIVAFCPHCKAFETLWFAGDVLTPTRKFMQEDSQVYHDCGSSQPCRLLPRFPKKGRGF